MPSLPMVMETLGNVVRARSMRSVGATTWASPVMTRVPSWLTHSQAIVRRFLCSSRALTVTLMRSWSPMRTGARNFSVCPR